MSSLTYSVSDGLTMFRRNLKRAIRYPGLTIFVVFIPVVFLLLFVYVFGGALGAGIVPGGGQEDYLEFVVPGILLVTVAGLMGGTAIGVSMDMHEGIVARFRSMSISRGAVLGGHVWGSIIQGFIALVLVMGTAVLIGFRPNADGLDWLLLIGVFALIMFALVWLAVGMGMQAKSVETASNLPLPFLLLPFLGAGFVPTDTMPEWLQVFAEWQPFTPFIETVRGLLLGTDIGIYGWLTVGWSILIAVGGYVWARLLYARKSVRG
jgi:ABC-2 type transport system permease protein